MKFLENFEEQAYAILRIVCGFLFIWHGTQKFLNFPIDYPYGPLNAMTTAAAAIEVIGGILVMLGLLTRPAAFICSGTMAVAYWMVHGTQALFPLANGGVLAALYCFVFLYISARGPGMWSIDKN